MFDSKDIKIKNTSYIEGSEASATVNNNNLTFGNAVKKTQNASRFITCQIGDETYKNLFEGQEPYYLEPTLEDKVAIKHCYEPDKEDMEKLVEKRSRQDFKV